MTSVFLIRLIFISVACRQILSEKVQCYSDEFRCADGKRCIGNYLVCDGFRNCDDESDEEPVFCKTWEYKHGEELSDDSEWDTDWSSSQDDEPEGNSEDTLTVNEIDFKENEEEFLTDSEKYKSHRCSISQCTVKGPIQYQDEKEYLYSYEVEINTTASQEDHSQSSSIIISADVKIQAVTACEMYLKLENAKFQSSTNTSNGEVLIVDKDVDFLQEIQDHDLRFSMVGGEIVSVCPNTAESKKSVNFKRGILSMLQNTMPKLHLSHNQMENDIAGNCEMKYQFEGANERNVVVSKTRNGKSCSDSTYFSSMNSGVPYDFSSKSNFLPILETTSKCVQEIRSQIFQDVRCVEHHWLVPFTEKDKKGIETKIYQKLKLVSSRHYFSSAWGPVTERKNLMFDWRALHSRKTENSHKNEQNFLQEINALLDRFSLLQENDFEEVEDLANMFRNLIMILRRVSSSDLDEIQRNRNWNEKDRKYFEDAISMTGTAESVRFIARQIRGLIIKEDLAHSWINSLLLISNPDLETMSALNELLEIMTHYPQAALHVGSVVHSYCSSHHFCPSESPIQDIFQKLSGPLHKSCLYETAEEKNQILASLQALGNAGLALTDNVINSLNKCILSEQADMDIIVAAISALRRVPCDNKPHQTLKEVLLAQEKDSEIRIHSYLSLMNCADYCNLANIEGLLETEQVNQVSSFIWTHLTNIQETSSKLKYSIQSLVSNRKFVEKFRSDIRKFSRNMEWSGFHETMNVGASLESNVIFSQKSYIPRSINFNFTTDLFGRSFNIFELGARVEGLENVLANLMGDEPEKSYNSINSRSINNLIGKVKYKDNLKKEPEVSFNARLFGNDVWYHRVNGLNDFFSKARTFDRKTMMQFFEEGKDIRIEKAFLPIDNSYTLATSSGFPLRLRMDASAVVDISANMKLDIRNIMKGKMLIKSHLRPSVNIKANTYLTIDGPSTPSGVKMEASFLSSTVIDGKIDLNGKNSLDINLNLPQDKMKIIQVWAKLALLHGTAEGTADFSAESIQNPDLPHFESEKCLSFVENFGFRLCATTSLPDPRRSTFNHRNLLMGPAYFNLDMRKTDVSLKSYKFRYKFVNTNEELNIQVSYDTPQTTINRERSISLGINYVTSEAHAILRTPDLSFQVKGNYKWEPDEKRLDASYSIGGQEEGSLTLGYKTHSKSGQSFLIPILTISRRERQLFKLSGEMQARERTTIPEEVHYSVDVQFEVDATNSGSSESQKANGNIGGYINKENYNWELSLDASYKFEGSEEDETINFYYKKELHSSNEPYKVLRTWRASLSQFPNLNTKGSWAKKRFTGAIENVIQASFGSDFANPFHQVDLYQNFIFYGGNKQTTFNSTFAIKYPKKNVDLILGLDVFHDTRDINTGFIFQYTTDEAVKSRLQLMRNVTNLYGLEGSFFLLVPSLADWKVKGNIHRKPTLEYQFDFEGIFSPSYSLKMAGDYLDHSTLLRSAHNLEMNMELPIIGTLYSNSTFLYDRNQVTFFTQATTQDLSTYKLRLAYINKGDDFDVQKRIEFDLHLPSGSSYFWHSEISIGQYFTISSDIHIDSYRDLHLWAQVLRRDNSRSSLEMKILWDANRYPQKKAVLKATLDNKRFDLFSSIYFLENEYRFTWQSARNWQINRGYLISWKHAHEGEFVWQESRHEIYKIRFGASFDLERSMGARLVANAYFTTPLQDWKNNSMQIEYTRNFEKIVAHLTANWHRDEFLNLRFDSGFQKFREGRRLSLEVDILSFINNNLVTFRTGGHMTKKAGFLEGKIFIQWDKDKVQFIIEMSNKSNPNKVQMLFLAKVLTTLEGYQHISTFADLLATKSSFNLHGAAKWESTLYELKCRGDVHTAREYLTIQLSLLTPQYGPETVFTNIRAYHDYKSHREILEARGNWLNNEFSLSSFVTLKDGFKAFLAIETPFEQLSQATVNIGFSRKENYMAEVWVKWNKTNDLGVRLLFRITSLTDFIISLALKSPLDKLKDINLEVQNLFQLSPNVRVHSRVFGQYAAKKYGLGCRYEQGMTPKLRVGLEIYFPVPDLEEVKFDISDESSGSRVRYNFELRHGTKKHFSVNTDFLKKNHALEFNIISGLTLAGNNQSDHQRIDFQSKNKFDWSKDKRFQIGLNIKTDSTKCKISGRGILTEDRSISVDGRLNLPHKGYSDIVYAAKLKLPSPIDEGHLNIKIKEKRIPIFFIDAKGVLESFSLSFKTPWNGYKEGSLHYTLERLDIVKSRVKGKAALEDQQITFSGLVFLNNRRDITKLELTISSTIDKYGWMEIAVEGIDEGRGFQNKVTFTSEGATYHGKIFYRISSQDDWTVNSEIYTEDFGNKKEYKANIEYLNVEDQPFVLSWSAMRIQPEYTIFSNSLRVQKSSKPYDITFKWEAPINSGNLKIIVESFEVGRILASISGTVEVLEDQFEEFMVKVDLQNKSTPNKVDVSLYTEISSDRPELSYILIDGRMTQITDEPGLLAVYLVWPEMNPVNFTAQAKYVGKPLNLRTSLSLNLTDNSYGFIGEIHEKDVTLTLNGGLWWQEGPLSEVSKVRLTTIVHRIGGNIESTTNLYIPMINGLEKSTVTFTKTKNFQWTDLKMKIDVANAETHLASTFKADRFPAIEGNATVSSTIFRGGKPLIILFQQTLTSDGCIGNYNISWPVWDGKTKSFQRKFIEANLNHSNIEGGQKGVLKISSPLTKGKTISLKYFIQSFKKPDFTLKLGLGYESISFDMKASHLTKTTRDDIRKKSSFELDNLIWPFGAAYLETIPHTGQRKGVENKIIIYDLYNNDRRSSVSFSKQSNENGHKLSIKGTLIERKMELSMGYEVTAKSLDTKIILAWSEDEEIRVTLNLINNSQVKGNSDYSLTAQMTHPLRTISMDADFKRTTDILFLDSSLNLHKGDESGIPLKLLIDFKKTAWSWSQRDIRGIVKLSHPSTLQKDLSLIFDLKGTREQPLYFNSLLQYSHYDNNDFSITATIDRLNKEFKNYFEFKHLATGLIANSKGEIRYDNQVYLLNQDAEYITNEGDVNTAIIFGQLHLIDKMVNVKIKSPSQNILDFLTRITEEGNGHYTLTTESSTHNSTLPAKAFLFFDHEKRKFSLKFNLSDDSLLATERSYNPEDPRFSPEEVVIDGGYEDERDAHVSMHHRITSNEPAIPVWFKDFETTFKLNNTKLLYSQIFWRKSFEHEIRNEMKKVLGMTQDMRLDARENVRKVLAEAGMIALQRTKRIANATLVALKPLINYLKNETRKAGKEIPFLFKNITMTRKEKALRDSILFTVKNIGKTLSNLKIVKRLRERLAKGTLRTRISNFIQRVKDLISKYFKKDGSSLAAVKEKIREFLKRIIVIYRNAVKQLRMSFRENLNEFKTRLKDWLKNKWHNLYYSYKPHILRTFHHIETATYKFVTTIWNTLKNLTSNLRSLTFIQNLEQIFQTLKGVYTDMSQRSLRDNIEFIFDYVTAQFFDTIEVFLNRVLPFIEDWINEIRNTGTKLMSYEKVRLFKKFFSGIFRPVTQSFNNINLGSYIVNGIVFIIDYSNGVFTRTAVQTHLSQLVFKSEMAWRPEEGRLLLVQKMPFTWYKFNEYPNMQNLFDIPYITTLKKTLFSQSKESLLDKWYKYFSFGFDPSRWLPPFPATGYVVGDTEIITFDGQLVSYSGKCEHLLAADVRHKTWAVSVKYFQNTLNAINVYVDGQMIEFLKQYKIKVNRRTVTLPLNLNSVYVWRSDATVHMIHRNGMKLSWNLAHQVISLTVPKNDFMNTVGLLGNNNYEPVDDLQTPDGAIFYSVREPSHVDIFDFVDSWKITDEQCYSEPSELEDPIIEDPAICKHLFSSMDSPFKHCFYQVNPLPYYNMCVRTYRGETQKSSPVALAYREKCSENFVPIKLPVQFVRCEYKNASTGAIHYLREGHTINFKSNEIEIAVDVVFLIELKSCNRHKLQAREFQRFVSAFSEGLRKNEVLPARFALVVFGGKGRNKEPTIVSFDSEIFVKEQNINSLLQDIQFDGDEENMIGNESGIIFDAINFASNLAFRSPVNVVFALFSCSSCIETHWFDYSTMYHIIKNNAARLFVFKSGYFSIEKESAQSEIAGIDSESAFMLKDFKRENIGDKALRNQIKTPKQELSLCLPLAFETKGGIFTSEMISEDKRKTEQFGLLVGRRVAEDTRQTSDQRCLCLSSQEVTPLLRCEDWSAGDITTLERFGMKNRPKTSYEKDQKTY